MTNILKTALMILTFALPTQLFAQTIIDGPDAARMATLMRVSLCEKTCRAGKLNALRYENPKVALENGFKLYVVTTRDVRQCRGQSCQQALIAVNRNDLLTLAEGFKLDPNAVTLPQRVAKTGQVEPQRATLCQAPGRRLNSSLIRQTFVGKTAVGRNDRGQGWSEFLGLDLSAVLTNEAGRKLQGRFEIGINQICVRYGKGEATCKMVYECTSGEGPFVFTDDRERLTGLVTRIVAGAADPDPAPQAQETAPSGDVTAELTKCRAVSSEIRRLRCYDAIADQFSAARFGREERRRLMQLMNFELSGGQLLVETQLDRCTLNIFLDAPQVRNAFSNETVIDLSALDIAASSGEADEGTALFTFVAKARQGWKETYTDRRRGTQRESESQNATTPVAARAGDLAEVEELIVAAAKHCQR